MVILDLLQYVLLTDSNPADFTCETDGAICPASAFTAIGAAFATQGYFVQADMIYFLTQTGFSQWAPLIYIMAAAGGMISLAMGMPPKMYMWFFFGPALYNWLLFTTEEVHGVQWSIANIEQNQHEVWKLAEAGLLNTNIVQREADPDAGSGNDAPIPHKDAPPDAPVRVSNLFIWFDSLMSGTAQWLVRWSGIYSLRGGGANGSGSGGGKSGIFDVSGSNTIDQYDRWYLMSNLKWSMLETIVSARLHNAYVRDLFTSYLSSECGDALSSQIDKKNFVAASHSKTGRIPCSVFLPGASSDLGEPGECLGDEPADYKALWKKLVGVSVPISPSMQKLWEDKGTGSLYKFFEDSTPCDPASGTCPSGAQAAAKIDSYFRTSGTDGLGMDDINCVDYLYLIINGFRWESGLIFHQLVMDAPLHMSKDGVLYHLFYNWDITTDGEDNLVKITNEDNDELENWAKDLILIHLVRNEMRLAPPITDRRFSGGSQIQADVDAYQATVGSKSKFGEVYTWALMVPYIQGVLMYLLAMGYPFACVLIVVPGWHKALFTWMSFWAWVKLWDVGFAIVGVLERSIWAMLGNNSTAHSLAPMIYQMQKWGKVSTGPCRIDYQASTGKIDTGLCPVIPEVVNMQDGNGTTPTFKNSIKIFDRALLLGANLDFDLANAYYIYIMSALYFAVPAATGQLVLGAKAGAAGMVSNMVGGASSEGGRAAGQGFTSRERMAASANSGTMQQEAYGKGMRKQGLAASALDAANQATESGLMASSAQGASQQLGLQNQNRGLGLQDTQNKNQVASAYSGFRAALTDPVAAAAFAAAGGYGANPPKGYGSVGKWGYVDQSNKDAQKAKENAQQQDQAAPQASGAAPGGGGGGGATGASGLGIWGVYSTAKGIMGEPTALYGAQASLAQLSNAAANQVMGSAVFGKQAALNNQQAALGRSSFTANAAREGYGLAGGRLNNQADFGANMARWQATTAYGNSVAPYLGAIGADTSFLSPGSKPTEMTGMAMSGMLGTSASKAAHYATPGHRYGSYWGIAAGESSYQQGLADQVRNAYSPVSFGAVTSLADNAQTSLLAGKNAGGPMQTDPTKSPYYQGK